MVMEIYSFYMTFFMFYPYEAYVCVRYIHMNYALSNQKLVKVKIIDFSSFIIKVFEWMIYVRM